MIPKWEKITKDGTSYTYKVNSCFDDPATLLTNLELEVKIGYCGYELFQICGRFMQTLITCLSLKNIIEFRSTF